MATDNSSPLSGDDLMDFAMGGVQDEVATPESDGQSKATEQQAPESGQESEQTEFDFGQERQPVDGNGRESKKAEVVDDSKAVDPKSLRPLGDNLTDAAGNIYDSRGTLLAKAGAERRMFERMTSVQEAMRHKDAYISQLEQQNKALQEQPPKESAVDQAIKQLKFSEPEVINGLRFTNLWKANPLNAVAHVLAEVKKLGYNDQQVMQAVQSYNPASDPAMIQSVVNEALRPVVDRIDGMNQARQPQGEDGLRSEITRVFAKYPGTHLHQDALANMVRQNPNLPLEDAVRGLIAFAQKNGLDYTQPLRPQIEARQNSQNRERQPNMPGRVPTDASPMLRETNQTAFASPDASYAEIVADVMKSQNRRA